MSVEIVALSPDEWAGYRAVRLEALQNEPQAFATPYARMAENPESYWRGRLAEAAEELPAAVNLPAAVAPKELTDAQHRKNLPRRDQKSWLLFAREDGRLVGMIGAFRSEEAAENLPANAAEIISVYVTPPARGRGISKLLMTAILEKLVQKGIHTVALGVVAEQTAAIRLYERFGFQVVGSHRLTLGDGLQHEVIEMERHL